MAADVMGHQLVDVRVVEVVEVHADTRGDVDAFHAGDGAGAAHQLDRRGVARFEQLADRGVDAREALAYSLDLWPGTAHPVLVPGRAGVVADLALEGGIRGVRLAMGVDRQGADA